MTENDTSGWERLIRSDEIENLRIELEDEGECNMSVILFSSQEVYTDMANAYEKLKHLTRYYGNQQEQDEEFYTSLRRLYFANVATWLCQYHDSDTPLPASELTASIEPFDIQQVRMLASDEPLAELYQLVRAWGSLKYNLVTNGGEQFRPVKAYEFIETIIARFTREALERTQQVEE